MTISEPKIAVMQEITRDIAAAKTPRQDVPKPGVVALLAVNKRSPQGAAKEIRKAIVFMSWCERVA